MLHFRWRLIPMLVLTTLAPATVAAQVASTKLTPRAAVERALKHNLGLKYDRLAPELTSAPERVARASFDTTLFGGLSASGDGDNLRLKLPAGFDLRGDLELGVRRTFTTGTRLTATLGGLLGYGGNGRDPGHVTAQTNLTLAINQPLLKGADPKINRAAITSARLDRSAAHQGLRRKAETTAADVLKTYWDLHAALASLRIQQVALKLSKQTVSETQDLITAGKVRRTESVEAEHQVKIQERAVLLAGQKVDNLRDQLSRLLGATGTAALKTPAFLTLNRHHLPLPTARLKDLYATALRHRGDYRALTISKKTRQLDLRVAGHGLLPSLDVVGSVGVHGHNNNRPEASDPTWGLAQGRVSWGVGLVLEVPLSHQEAKAKRDMASLRLRQVDVSVVRQRQRISEELKVALRGLKAAQALVVLAGKAVKVAETKLTNARDRYRAGKTPARLVALVRADLVQERLEQQQAMATLHKALVDLWSATGTLIKQLGSQGH